MYNKDLLFILLHSDIYILYMAYSIMLYKLKGF
jgi:hypothetical protein